MTYCSTLAVMACGNVDDGKSTLMGRLLFECGAVPDDVMDALAQDSERWGTVEGGLDYALLVDGLAAEREQGITIDVAYRYFATPKRRFIVADCPGHEQYTRNMVTAASTADLAVLVIDAQKGMAPQTLRHAAIAALLGVKNIMLAVNKMDLVGFRRAVFDAIVADFATFAARLPGVTLTAIPIVASQGDNVTEHGRRMPWYRGPTVLSALEAARADAAATRPAFRMHVQWVNRPHQGFRGFAGTVDSGLVRPGMSVVNVTAGANAKIARIVTMDGDLDEARCGDAVTLVLDSEIDGSRGDVLASLTSPPLVADRITAQVIWMSDAPVRRGCSYLLMLGSRVVSGTILEPLERCDIETHARTPATELATNEIGRLRVLLSQPVAIEPYRLSRTMGGFILIDHLTNATVGAGLIEAGEATTSNIYWYKLDIDKNARAAMKQQRPVVLWFTGLSSAGKSTLANLVEKRLHALGRHTMMLDGDNVRHGLSRDLGFGERDRVENIRRLAEVSWLFVEAGVIVLVSCISPYRADRMMARMGMDEGEFLEIYVDTPIEECRRRDRKGLYARADSGQIRDFTGVDAPYEPPEDPDVHVETMNKAPEELVGQIVEELRTRGIIP